ncbi:MAG: DUF732 domain-containing protein [Mycobacterium sp.]|nr:DUF732 domain-containing protein [Mycobacterium sp.]
MAAALARIPMTTRRFLNAVHSQGFRVRDGNQHLIKFGHSICTRLADGYSETG